MFWPRIRCVCVCVGVAIHHFPCESLGLVFESTGEGIAVWIAMVRIWGGSTQGRFCCGNFGGCGSFAERPGFEPGSLGREPNILTATLSGPKEYM